MEVHDLAVCEKEQIATVGAITGGTLTFSNVADAGDAEALSTVGAVKSNVVSIAHMEATVRLSIWPPHGLV